MTLQPKTRRSIGWALGLYAAGVCAVAAVSAALHALLR